MSIINITLAAISGALFSDKESTREILVSKGTKAPVIMTGYVGSPDVKNQAGDYVPGPYGRLEVLAAKTGEGDKARMILEVAGGLRGVLFKVAPKEGEEPKNYQYSGNIDAGNGNEFPIFGRLVEKEGKPPFISLSSGEARQKKEDNHAAPAAPAARDEALPF